jgi:YidC/Oxa1 family membrane protein insertase
MNKETRNLGLAILLSMAFVFGWNKFYVEPKLKAQKAIEAAAKANNPETVAMPASITADGANTTSATPDAVAAPAQKVTREEILSKAFAANERVKINTGKLHGSINLKGASFDDLTLAEYKETLEEDSKEVVLLSPRGTENVYFTETGFLSSNTNTKLPNKDTIWSADKTELKNNETLTLTWDNGEGLVFKKIITLDENYLFTVKDEVVNNTGNEIAIAPFSLVNRSKGNHTETYVSHEGAMALTNDILELATYDKTFEDKKIEYTGVKGWAAIGDKYWLTAIIPDQNLDTKYNINFKGYEKDGSKRFQVDMLGEAKKIASGSSLSNTNYLYLGAKKVKLLDEYSHKYNIKLFDRTVDFGSLYFLTKPMFEILHFFFNKIGNFGIAILCLTVVVRILLFPLANMSYKSMAKMKKYMPEINKIKEKYATDKQKQGTEMMKLYKEKRVNPASGCLPLFVQIPVFFALYKVLYVTIEMRHAPFFGWIKDLSEKDPTNVFNLFGLIPIIPPMWLPVIGVLPILYTLTMVLQQKLNPPATDPSQAMVMKWLPWIFLFIFASFPAGLVVYWIWNNILSIIQQYIITKRVEEEK